MMQRCDGKQGCTNQIVMKKGRKQESLSLLNVSKRFTDNWAKERAFFRREISNNRNSPPEGYHLLTITYFGKIFIFRRVLNPNFT
jgi:hypothetical protein